MALTVPSKADLAKFMHVDANALSSYEAEARPAATDLMFIATSLESDPTDPQRLRILQRGILAMAEDIINSLPMRAAQARGLKSESVGSYSYTMGEKVRKGDATGVLWFDIAVRFFNSGSDISSVTTHVFETSDGLLHRHKSTGDYWVVGPATDQEALNKMTEVDP